MSEVGEILLGYGLQILGMIIGTLFVVLVRSGLNYLTFRIGADKVEWLREAAFTAVRAIEQKGLISPIDGETKKAIVVLSLQNLRDQYNIPVTDDMIDNFVEAGVQIMNQELKHLIPEQEKVFENPSPAGAGL